MVALAGHLPDSLYFRDVRLNSVPGVDTRHRHSKGKSVWAAYSRSKYMPHVGRKHRAKLERRAALDAASAAANPAWKGGAA